MKPLIRSLIAATLVVLTVAASLVLYTSYVWRPAVIRGDFSSLDHHVRYELQHAVEARRVASAALVLLRDRNIASELALGVASRQAGAPTTTDRTQFIVASVSKAVTAWGVMTLVQDARLSLDEPVLPRLRRWQFPPDAGYRERVTVRHLLSHTAGLNDGLGYGGFGAGEPVQQIEESLAGPRDSTVGVVGAVAVVREPGTAMAYSGGGYAVLQLLVEEVTGQPFAEYMADAVLRPLGMASTTFDPIAGGDVPLQIADGVDAQLRPQPPRRYAAVAPVGLHATARDLSRFAQALAGPNPVLKAETMAAMLTPQPGTGGSWGLGHALFADAGATARVVGHDGGTPPSWGASVRVNPVNGDGFVLLASGGGTLVTTLADAWTYWETGVVSAAARRQRLVDMARPAAVVALAGALVGALLVVRRP